MYCMCSTSRWVCWGTILVHLIWVLTHPFCFQGGLKVGSELYAIMEEEERTTVQDQSLMYLLCPTPANKAVHKLALPMQHCIRTVILKMKNYFTQFLAVQK